MPQPARPPASVPPTLFVGYPPRARVALQGLWTAAALVTAASLAALVADPATPWMLVAFGVGGAGVAGATAVRLPRTPYSISAADGFVFLTLALCGPAAAVLAAAAEGALGGWRVPGRMLSRLSSPALFTLGAAASGAVHEAILAGRWLGPDGQDVMGLVALCVSAPVSVLVATHLPLAIRRLKGGPRLERDAWVASLLVGILGSLGAALVAAMVAHWFRHVGPEILVVVAVLAGVFMALLRTLAERIGQQQAIQEREISRARQDADDNLRQFMHAFEGATIGMAIVDVDGGVVRANPALATMLGHTGKLAPGPTMASLVHPEDRPRYDALTAAVVATGTAGAAPELRLLCADGRPRWASVHASVSAESGDHARQLHLQLVDIHARRLAETRLQHMAYHDGATGLLNRHGLRRSLDDALRSGDTGGAFTLMCLNVDRFKAINDSLGHANGDRLLVELAARLRCMVREVDTVARLGGDEFALILRGMAARQTAEAFAGMVVKEIVRPVELSGHECVTSASIGVVTCEAGSSGGDELLRSAGLALRQAKAAGGNQAVFFDESMHGRMIDRLAIERDLRTAIVQRQIQPHFQPIVDIRSGVLRGFEALARWEHPVRGPVNPGLFVAVAEETGQVSALTDAILDQALGRLAGWRRSVPAAEHLALNVNISGQDLARSDLPVQVAGLLARHGVPPPSLTLEITETTLMSRVETARDVLARLREIGVRLSIDDFGTGYSSLAYLSRLPFDSLKIDRSFVQVLPRADSDREIVRAIVNLALSLGCKVVAEGIETHEQRVALQALGVHDAQGWLFGRPLAAHRVEEWLWSRGLAGRS